ncbi:hypothetical protein BH09PAT2_BH09PAT2_09760 [soil metagenome]
MSDLLLIILVVASTITILVVLRMWLRGMEEKSKVSDDIVSWLKDVSTRVENSNQQVDRKLSQNMDIFNQRLDRTAETMMNVQRSIGEFAEIGRSMQQLQQFLQSPKLRGNIGEQVLKELLSQCLPADCFMLQYSFKNGEKVDAVIKTSQGLVPVDSKFPISNFKKMHEHEGAEKEQYRKDFIKDVKIHIKSISQKYILASENTVDYALMYIPSESVYYEIINQGDIYDYASSMRIVPVSPMSFYAFLKVILISFEGQRVQKEAKEILKVLQSMKKDYEKADESLSILNKHISNAYNQTSQVTRSLSQLGQKIEHTSSLSIPEIQEKLIE